MASEVCSHVKVVVRVRPTGDNEKGEGFRKVVQVVDNHMLIFDPKEEVVSSSFGGQRVRNRNINRRPNKDVTFVFDNVFGEDSTQVDLFENTTKGVLDGVLNGFNCAVFAYGATGAGKTHTMLGSQGDPGVMYRTMTELFSRMEEVKEEKVFDVAFSYLEVYNEQIRDLLANVGPLALREDASKGVVVQGLTLHQPKSAEHILQALDHGNRNRTQHPTEMNATSSRSHAVFQIYLKQQERTASLNPNVHKAKLSLIDLAGSERASATNAKGARAREGANINRSLLALGNVINALANPLSKKTHIPYRDSKLTRLLKDSLGGNCRTVMIANVSPSSKSYDDTHNTLKYANRAKEIKSSLKSNVVSLDSHISQYAVVCEQQRKEILKLKKQLKESEEKKADVAVPGASNTTCTQKQAEFHKVSESLRSIFSSRGQIRREQLSLERLLKENELRQRYNEDSNLHVQFFCARDKTEKATCKYERKMASLLTQHKHLHKRLGESEQRFLDNDGWLHRVENEMKLLGQEAQPPEVLRKDLQGHRLGLQVSDLQQQIEHMTQLIVLQDQENRRAQKMVNALLPAYSRQYGDLRRAGMTTPADETENRELEHLVLRERAVVWADQEMVRRDPGDGTGEETREADEGRTSGQELAPFLSFSHLLYHQNSPCSAEARGRRVSLRLQTKGEQTVATQKPPTKNPIRRNLSASLSAPNPVSTGPTASQEDIAPLQCTPEPAAPEPAAPHTTSTLPLHPSNDPNMTFEILDTEEDPSLANSTIILQTDISSQESSHLSMPQPPRANGSTQRPGPTTRPEIPSLLDLRRAKPPYMAMTSAAQGKRKYGCVKAEGAPDQSVPKRMRIHRFGGSEENEPRRVVRSVSEGNLNLLQRPKKKSIFYKTSQQFKLVTKRL